MCMSCFSLFVSYYQAAILVIAIAKLNSLLAGCSLYLDADGRGGAGCFRGQHHVRWVAHLLCIG